MKLSLTVTRLELHVFTNSSNAIPACAEDEKSETANTNRLAVINFVTRQKLMKLLQIRNGDGCFILIDFYPIALSTASPSVAGLSATTKPADFIASILSSAPPLPPATIAPA